MHTTHSPWGATQRQLGHGVPVVPQRSRPCSQAAPATVAESSMVLAAETGYLGPSLASRFLISGLSYKTTFKSELRISSFPLYSI